MPRGPAAGRSGERTPGHRKRRTARRLAIDVLYQADVTERAPDEVLRDWKDAGRSIPPYTEELIARVQDDRADIDAALSRSSSGWPVHRMAVLDRTILRVACAEIRAGLPSPVAINEAVDAASELSTEDSGRFVNGVLGEVVRRASGSAKT